MLLPEFHIQIFSINLPVSCTHIHIPDVLLWPVNQLFCLEFVLFGCVCECIKVCASFRPSGQSHRVTSSSNVALSLTCQTQGLITGSFPWLGCLSLGLIAGSLPRHPCQAPGLIVSIPLWQRGMAASHQLNYQRWSLVFQAPLCPVKSTLCSAEYIRFYIYLVIL